jgi:hypothetical protein
MKVAINGLGRIGRQVLRRIQGTPGLELVAVNDLGELAGLAHLVQYDSLHGRAGFPVGHEDGCLLLDQTPVPCFLYCCQTGGTCRRAARLPSRCFLVPAAGARQLRQSRQQAAGFGFMQRTPRYLAMTLTISSTLLE